jgi:hypothetical protein
LKKGLSFKNIGQQDTVDKKLNNMGSDNMISIVQSDDESKIRFIDDVEESLVIMESSELDYEIKNEEDRPMANSKGASFEQQRFLSIVSYENNDFQMFKQHNKQRINVYIDEIGLRESSLIFLITLICIYGMSFVFWTNGLTQSLDKREFYKKFDPTAFKTKFLLEYIEKYSDRLTDSFKKYFKNNCTLFPYAAKMFQIYKIFSFILNLIVLLSSWIVIIVVSRRQILTFLSKRREKRRICLKDLKMLKYSNIEFMYKFKNLEHKVYKSLKKEDEDDQKFKNFENSKLQIDYIHRHQLKHYCLSLFFYILLITPLVFNEFYNDISLNSASSPISDIKESEVFKKTPQLNFTTDTINKKAHPSIMKTFNIREYRGFNSIIVNKHNNNQTLFPSIMSPFQLRSLQNKISILNSLKKKEEIRSKKEKKLKKLKNSSTAIILDLLTTIDLISHSFRFFVYLFINFHFKCFLVIRKNR